MKVFKKIPLKTENWEIQSIENEELSVPSWLNIFYSIFSGGWDESNGAAEDRAGMAKTALHSAASCTDVIHSFLQL